MKIQRLDMPECLRIFPKLVRDKRGYFVKPFVISDYQVYQLQTQFAEEYYSRSTPGVLRGLHFQTPPYEYYKLVTCVYGKVRDAILDVRVGSPTYGQCRVFEMDAQDGWVLYLPPGIAHGFLAQTEAIVNYKVTSLHVPSHDGGIRWDSVPVDWGIDVPMLSPRDQGFPTLQDFKSPFVYHPEENQR